MDHTNITDTTDDGSRGAALRIIGASEANFADISGLTFIKGADHPGGIVQIYGQQAAMGFRFHHNRLWVGSPSSQAVQIEGVYGLIDHVTFDVTEGPIQAVAITGSADSLDGGFMPWSRPLSLGTVDAVYIEDSTFNYSDQSEDAIDAYGGARLVIRHNVFTNVSVGFHGLDSGGRRSVFSFEIYDNVFTNDSTTILRGATIRGGTGVIYNNTYGGTRQWYDVTLMVYRACPPLDQSDWKTCDGTNWQLGSTVLSSDASRTASLGGGVKFCSNARDTVCRVDDDCGGSGTCSTFLDGSGAGGYPCRDQPGRTHDQVLSPVYTWNNGHLGIGNYNADLACGLGIDTYLRENRDFYNVPRPGYVAYMYPHALSSPQIPPSAPTNLRIIR
jgi:hypothetical protein